MTKRSVLGLKTSVSYKLVHFAKNDLKSSAPCAKMTKRSDLGLKTSVLYKLVHFAENAKRWCAQCENDKTFWSRAENAVLYELVHFAWRSLKSGTPSAKMTKRADFSLRTLFCTNSCTSLKIAKKRFAQCKNDKTFWSRAENVCFVQTPALCWKC